MISPLSLDVCSSALRLMLRSLSLHLQLSSSACRQTGGPDPFSGLISWAVCDMRPQSYTESAFFFFKCPHWGKVERVLRNLILDLCAIIRSWRSSSKLSIRQSEEAPLWLWPRRSPARNLPWTLCYFETRVFVAIKQTRHNMVGTEAMVGEMEPADLFLLVSSLHVKPGLTLAVLMP